MATGSKAVKAEAQHDPDKPTLVREVTIDFEGVEYSIRGDTMDDVELLENLEDEQYIKVLRRILGTEKWSAFKDSVRTPEGRVPTAKLEEFLQVVMGALDPNNAS